LIEDIPRAAITFRALQPNATVGLCWPARRESHEHRLLRHVAERGTAPLAAALGVGVLRVARHTLRLDECFQDVPSALIPRRSANFTATACARSAVACHSRAHRCAEWMIAIASRISDAVNM
jgi:hypothetical protein